MPPKSWLELSELTTGLALAGRLPVQAIRPDILFPPYDEIIKSFKDGKTISEIIIGNSTEHVQAAIAAEENINGTGDKADWLKHLEQAYVLYQEAEELQRLTKKMKQNDPDAGLQAREIVNKTAARSVGTNRRKLSDIEPNETPFIKTGWEIFDAHTGGLPAFGLVLVGGAPSSGKTEFAKTLSTCYAKAHKDKTVVIYSAEMMAEELSGRFKTKGSATLDWHNNIQIDDKAFMTPEYIVADSASIENLGLIIIDFVDLLIAGGGDENKYSGTYIYLMQAAKQLQCPIVVLAQFSRTYSGGIPRPQNFRYTGLAEALGWTLITLYNPTTDYFEGDEDNDILPPVKGYAYLCIWKQRGGFRIHPNDSPGAICLPFIGGRGWHPTKGQWVFIRKSKKKG